MHSNDTVVVIGRRPRERLASHQADGICRRARELPRLLSLSHTAKVLTSARYAPVLQATPPVRTLRARGALLRGARAGTRGRAVARRFYPREPPLPLHEEGGNCQSA